MGVTLLALAVVISFVFGSYLSVQRVTDPFLYYDISFVKTSENSIDFRIPDEGPFSSLRLAPGRVSLLQGLVGVLGIEPETLQFLPIGSVLLATSCFYLALRLLGSPAIALLYSLYLGLNLSHATALYSTFAYAFALPMFLGFVLTSILYLEKRETRDLIIIFIMFIALNAIHYTLASWAILYLVGFGVALLTQKPFPRNTSSQLLRNPYLVILILVVLFLAFNDALYDSYIPVLSRKTMEMAFDRFLSFISISSGGETSSYRFQRATAINFMSTLTLILIVVPVVVGVASDIQSLFVVKARRTLSVSQLPIRWGFLFLGIGDALVYSFRGSVSTKAFSMVFPILAIMYLKHLNRRWIYNLLPALLLSTSLIKIVLFYQNAYVIDGNGAPIETVSRSSGWIQAFTPEDKYRILADMNLYGKYLLTSDNNGEEPVLEALTEQRLRALVGDEGDTEAITADFVAIDRESSQPALGFTWAIFRPLNEFLDSLFSNRDLSIIFDDGHVLLGVYQGDNHD